MVTPPIARRAVQRTLILLATATMTALGLSHGWDTMRRGPVSSRSPRDPASPDNAVAETIRFRVDLNRAELGELALLPGVGPVLAQRIIDHRRTVGPFTEFAELRQVRGIGPKKLEELAAYCLVDSPRIRHTPSPEAPTD